MKKVTSLVISITTIMLIFSGCAQQEKKKLDLSQIQQVESFKLFQKKYAKKEVLLFAEKDINEDDKKDLVIIFKDGEAQNGMVLIYSEAEGYKLSQKVRAPIDDQRIEFKNIDDELPVEIIVTGSKAGKIGYAIFRLEDGRLKDIFGEGMDECC